MQDIKKEILGGFYFLWRLIAASVLLALVCDLEVWLHGFPRNLWDEIIIARNRGDNTGLESIGYYLRKLHDAMVQIYEKFMALHNYNYGGVRFCVVSKSFSFYLFDN